MKTNGYQHVPGEHGDKQLLEIWGEMKWEESQRTLGTGLPLSGSIVSTRPRDHNLTSLAFPVINSWAANPLIPNWLTREVENPDQFRCRWRGPNECPTTLQRKPSSYLAWLLGQLPTRSLCFHFIPSTAHFPVGPQWPLEYINQILLLPCSKISNSFPGHMDWSQNSLPWPKMPRWLGPCPPVWNQVYHCASSSRGSYPPAFSLSRSRLGLWACYSLSGMLFPHTFTRLLDSGLSPTVTSLGWPVLTPLSLSHHYVPNLCLSFSEPINTWNYILSLFIVCLTH